MKNVGNKRAVDVCGHVSCSAVMYTGRVLRSVDKKAVRQRINIGATEVLKMEAAERIFTEFPGERVYLLFDILLAHSGTVQVFEHKVYVGPTAPQDGGPDLLLPPGAWGGGQGDRAVCQPAPFQDGGRLTQRGERWLAAR